MSGRGRVKQFLARERGWLRDEWEGNGRGYIRRETERLVDNYAESVL